jgi:RNA polymerase sigma-70 factor (ECF subfamily)
LLVPAARKGDRAAIARVIDLTQDDVRRFLAVHTRPSEADDLTQETFLRVLSSLPRFEQRSSLRTWMLVIARRVAADHLRYRASRPQVADVDDWVSAAESSSRVDGAHADPAASLEISDLLDRLAPDRREALVLTQVIGLDYQEAADVLGCPIGTVRSRIARGRDDLVRMMTVEGGERRLRSV